MMKLERDLTQLGAIVLNDQVIIAGYGLQANYYGFSPGVRSLKFARFKTFGFGEDDIQFIGSYGQVCPGRS